MVGAMGGDPYCRAPGDKVGAQPLRSWKACAEFISRFHSTGPHRFIDKILHALVRSPEAVRKKGLIVERARDRLAELRGVSREGRFPHKRNQAM
eukprot:15456886-Alexandrium_andersonii.AAC.1